MWRESEVKEKGNEKKGEKGKQGKRALRRSFIKKCQKSRDTIGLKSVFWIQNDIFRIRHQSYYSALYMTDFLP